jgi:hypothetical protein
MRVSCSLLSLCSSVLSSAGITISTRVQKPVFTGFDENRSVFGTKFKFWGGKIEIERFSSLSLGFLFINQFLIDFLFKIQFLNKK